jgi:MFS family permease
MAAYGPAMFSHIGDVSRTGRYGKAYGAYTLAQQVAMASGPTFGGLIADFWGYRQTFVCSGVVISIAVVVGLTFFPDSGRIKKERIGKEISKTFLGLYHNKLIVFSWVTVFSFYFMHGVTPPFLPLYAKNIGLSISMIAFLFTLQSFTNAVSRVIFGSFYDRFKKVVPPIIASLIVGAFSTVLLSVSTEIVSLGLFMSVIGICFGTTTMIASATIAEVTTPDNRGLAMGIFNACFYGAMAVSPVILGPIISRFGFQNGFWFTGVNGLFGSFIAYLIIHSRKSSHTRT